MGYIIEVWFPDPSANMYACAAHAQIDTFAEGLGTDPVSAMESTVERDYGGLRYMPLPPVLGA